MDALGESARVDLNGQRGHDFDAVVLAYARGAAAAELRHALGIFPQRKNALGETIDAVRIHQSAAAGLLNQLRIRASPRLHDRHAGGQSFEKEQPIRLVDSSGYAEDVQIAQEIDLVDTVE